MPSPLDDSTDHGPRIGALLRLCHQAFLNRVSTGLTKAGYAPIFGAVIQPLWDRPEGMRLTELASYAGVTKQSMGELVDKMVAVGYVERVPDPTDRRAIRVRFTKKGTKVAQRSRALVREIEASWAKTVGKARVERLRETLRAILERERG